MVIALLIILGLLLYVLIAVGIYFWSKALEDYNDSTLVAMLWPLFIFS